MSTRDVSLIHGCPVPNNVVLVEAHEPHFSRLMASALLVVIPLTAGRLRGAGEASFLNAMWHGRPVICADDLSAAEYFENGVEGIVVSPGNPARLRDAILALWRNREKAEAIGQAGMRRAEAEHTQLHFVQRMFALADPERS